MTLRIALFALCFLPSLTAAADFAGTLEMTVTNRHGQGTTRVYLGKAGVRSEVKIASQGAQMDMVFLHLFKNRDVAYRIDDAQKTYAEIDLKANRDARAKSEGTYSAQKIGVETVRGYSCIHALVTDSDGNETDIWTSKDIANFHEISKMMGPNAPANEGMSKALKEVNADGFPVKVVHKSKNPDIGETTMELVKVEKKAPPAALLQIPAGYRKLDTPKKHVDDHGPQQPHAPPPLPPEFIKQLEAKMKQMTPEQRDAAKRMLREQGIQVD